MAKSWGAILMQSTGIKAIFASNSNVWTSSRTAPLDISASHYVPGVTKLAASDGSCAIRMMNDAEYQNVAHSTIGGAYYDVNADRIYQSFEHAATWYSLMNTVQA